MSDKYTALFQPIKINSLEVKNRLAVPPMGSGFAADGGGVSDRLIKYHEKRAKGGFGMIIVEVTAIDGDLGLGSGQSIFAGAPGHFRLSYPAQRRTGDPRLFKYLPPQHHQPGSGAGRNDHF